jgi:hypothetical protein
MAAVGNVCAPQQCSPAQKAAKMAAAKPQAPVMQQAPAKNAFPCTFGSLNIRG